MYGGAGSGGKSYWLRWSALGFLLYLTQKYQVRGIEVGLFSEDYPTLKDRQISKIAKEFPSWLGELKESQQDGYAFRVRDEYGGGLIKLRNLDDPSKYASAEFAGVFVEELTKNPETTFEDLRFRMRWPGISEVKFAGATNPGQIGHGWCKRKWVKPPINPLDQDLEQDRFFYVPATASDNKYISRDYIRQLEALPEKKRKMLLLGSWDEPEGQFFEEWNDRIHICPPFMPRKGTLIVGGLDWGRVKPFSFHLSTVERMMYEEQVFYRSRTFFEVYGTGKNPREWAEMIIDKLKRYNLTLDDVTRVMADTQIFVPGIDNSISIADQFIQTDPGFRILKGASKDRIGGWENLHNWLSTSIDGLPYWQISKDCPHLIRTLPELVYDTVHQGKIEDVNTEGEDHACFCRHTEILTKRGYVPIVEVKVGELLWTPLGWSKALRLINNGIHHVEHFRSMKVTNNHPFLTQDGFLQLKHLTSRHRLWNVSISSGNHTGDIHVHQDFPIGSIFGVVRRRMEKVPSHFTPTSGSFIMVRFPKVYISIIRIKILLETLLRILRWSLLPTMLNFIRNHVWLVLGEILKSLDHLQVFGTDHQQEKSSTASWLKPTGNIKRWIRIGVQRVMNHIRHISQQSQSSAVLTAKCDCSGREEVWNLETDTGMFTAQGVVVSNSDDQRYEKKSLKWLDARVGYIARKEDRPNVPKLALIDPATGKQVLSDSVETIFTPPKSGGAFYKW